MSVSVSFGSAPSTFDRQRPVPQQRNSNSQTYLPQTLVLGLFLLIFGAQIAVNMAQMRRVQRRRLGEGIRRTIVVNGPEPGRQEGETVVGERRDRGEGVVREGAREEPGEEPGERPGERLETRDAG